MIGEQFITDDPEMLGSLLAGKTPEALELLAHFIDEFANQCALKIHPAKTIIRYWRARKAYRLDHPNR